MRDVLVFNGSSNLDFQEIRTNVGRIPEVVARIREAQKIWDTVATQPLDLANFIGSEDISFLGNIKLKSFATAVVQVGDNGPGGELLEEVLGVAPATLEKED